MVVRDIFENIESINDRANKQELNHRGTKRIEEDTIITLDISDIDKPYAYSFSKEVPNAAGGDVSKVLKLCAMNSRIFSGR